MKQPHTRDEAKRSDSAENVPIDKPDGPKEHFETIRFLIDQIKAEKHSDATKAMLDKITNRLDLIEGKPEAVEAEKKRLAQIQEEANVEKAKADKDAKVA